MKKKTLLILVLAVLLAACAGKQAQPSGVESPDAAPEIPAFDPSILEPGTSMPWHDGNELAFVPAGEFLMGGQDGAPERKVALSAFWIDRYEVTRGMYLQCVLAGACKPPEEGFPNTDDLFALVQGNRIVGPSDNGIVGPSDNQIVGPSDNGIVGPSDISAVQFGQNFPMTGVTHAMAQKYCGWLGGRLPTETEWEKAARGEAGQPLAWEGGQADCAQANSAGCGGFPRQVSDHGASNSPYGLFDMAGNADEWVADWYGQDLPAAGEQDPQGPASGEQRVVRGGSYLTDVELMGAARRFFEDPTAMRPDLGFRCVVEDPFRLAPFCDLPPSSSEPGADAPAPTCEVELPDVVEARYCVNQATQTGGVNVSVSNPEVGYGFNVLEPGSCELSSVPGIIYTCVGPENTGIQLLSWNSCGVVEGEGSVEPSCPAGYLLTGEGTCEFAGLPGDTLAECPPGYLYDRTADLCVRPGVESENCPQGYVLDPLRSCCTVPAVEARTAPSAFAACPVGYEYRAYVDGTIRCDKIFRTESQVVTVFTGNCGGAGGGGGGSRCPAGQSWVCTFMTYPPDCSCE